MGSRDISTNDPPSQPQQNWTLESASDREPRWGCVLAAAICGTLIVCCGVLGWWLDRPLYRRTISARECLTIRETKVTPTESTLRMTYHYPPGIGLMAVSDIQVPTPKEAWAFVFVEEPSLRLSCVFDANQVGVLYLYDHRNHLHWVPGMSQQQYVVDSDGALVARPTYWQEQLDAIRTLHPEIPYATLP
jgi:hypothetical protein